MSALARDELVVFPTDTLYGLGAAARSAAAVARLVAVRGREAGKPIPVLVRDLAMAQSVAASIPSSARRLAERFWPGALTLVLPAREDLPPALSAGTGTIGVRAAAHPVAAALVDGLGAPVTATSANPPGREAPRRLETARLYFGASIAIYLDGGALAGEASTVALCEGDGVRVLRAGPVGEAALRTVLAERS